MKRGRSLVPNEPLRATVTIDAVAPVEQAHHLMMSLYDTHGRLLAYEDRPLGQERELVFTFEPAALRNMGLEWRAELRRGNVLLDSDRERAICIAPRDLDSLQFSSWGGMYLWRTEYLNDIVSKRVEQLGLDVSLYGGVEHDSGKVWREYWQNRHNWFSGILEYHAKDVLDFRLRDFAKVKADFSKSGDTAFLERKPCLNDPQWREAMREGIQAKVRSMMAEGGSYVYCTGDEMSLTYYRTYFDFCWSEHCLTKFRNWLADVYGGLAEVNDAWSTDFATWDEVVPLTLEEAREAENAAPWADHRSFMDTTIADFMAFTLESIREVDPEGHCGMSGTQAPRSGNGMDWWKMSEAFDYYHSYNTEWSNEMRRSFAADTGVMQSPYYAGYWQSGRNLEYNMWWCLLHDTVGISAWTTHLFFYGDLTFSEAGRDTRDNIRELKNGVWAQVREAQRLHDGIALHYSHPSIQAAKLEGREDHLAAVRDAWVKLLEDCGLQYDFVSRQQIEAGKLAEGYRVLVLPESIAISEAEQATIREFVAAGGSVLADQNCGLRNGHCRPLGEGALDDLFGLTRGDATGMAPPAGLVAQADLGADLAEGDEVKVTVPEPALQATAATAFGLAEGGVPALMVNEVGQGRAMYLNVDLSQFETERKFHSPTERQLRSALLGMLEPVGITPLYTVSYESGQAPHVEVIRYQMGELTMLGLLRVRGDGDDQVATIKLPETAHVYSMRQHKYLGKMDSITAPMASGQALVYCLSPTRLPGPSVKATASAQAGEMVAYSVAVEGGPDVPQVVRVTVEDPEGNEVGASHIPLALDDAPGTWTVRAVSALSGRASRASFEVTEG